MPTQATSGSCYDQYQSCGSVTRNARGLTPHRLRRRHAATLRLKEGRPCLVRAPREQRRRGLQLCTCSSRADYAASAADSDVLQRPIKEPLRAEEVKNVFGYPRNLRHKYVLGAVLGAGSFGIVREAEERGGLRRRFACKTVPKVPKRGAGTPRYLLKLQTEVDVMRQLGSSLDAVFLKDVFEDDGNIHIIMELCEGGGILDRMKAVPFTERQVARIIRSVLRFIAQCHARGVIYRDVKPDNFLFLTREADSPVRATDFGLAIRHWGADGRLKSRSGTPVYMAPEVILQDYGPAADVWSVGMLMYQLLTGGFPFWSEVANLTLQQVWQAVLTKPIDFESAKLRQCMSPPAIDLLKAGRTGHAQTRLPAKRSQFSGLIRGKAPGRQGLLQRDEGQRLTAAQALEHPWARRGGVAPETPLQGTVVQRLQRHATYGRLKQLVLRMIVEDVIGGGPDIDTERMVTALRELFVALDTDGSGTVDEGELAAGLAAQGYGVTRGEVAQLLQRVDLDADGHIAFAELAPALLDWKQLQQGAAWVTWVDLAFARLDLNGDGYISLEEILARLPMLAGANGLEESERRLEARRMLREADDNGDGRVSLDEFRGLFAAQNVVPDALEQYDSRLLEYEAQVPAS